VCLNIYQEKRIAEINFFFAMLRSWKEFRLVVYSSAVDVRQLPRLRGKCVEFCALLFRVKSQSNLGSFAAYSFLKFVPAHRNREEMLTNLVKKKYRSLPGNDTKVWLGKSSIENRNWRLEMVLWLLAILPL